MKSSKQSKKRLKSGKFVEDNIVLQKSDNNPALKCLPMNVFGFFICISLSLGKKKNIAKSKICKALAISGGWILICLCIQFLVVYNLFELSLQKWDDIQNTTAPDVIPLSIGSVILFYFDLSQNCADIFLNVMCIFAKQVVLDNATFEINIPVYKRMLLFCLASLPEIVVYVGVIVSGTLFILCSTKEDFILNNLALTYIMLIDEMLLKCIVPSYMEGIMNKNKLVLKNYFHSRSGNCFQRCQGLYVYFFHVPVVVCLSFAAVFLFTPYNVDSHNVSSYLTMATLGAGVLLVFVGIVFYKQKRKFRVAPE